MKLRARRLCTFAAAAVALLPSSAQAWPEPEDSDIVAELHFQPVSGLQMAIWLTDAEGKFIRDIFVTQSTGKLGIGNRSGIWNFLSSWRAPYGPRRSVLPVWAHARGKTYPKIVFHDPNESHATSLGFHEATSSAEPYHCRPLLEQEHEAILDSMTCPSPSTFRTDKGRFDMGGLTSVYPPRGDIPSWNPDKDHVDVQMYGALNDLDAVTGATPPGGGPDFVSFRLSTEEAAEPTLVAWIEVNLEADMNADWTFDRENDHFVDGLLQSYGIPYLGQPSVVYRVSFDPAMEGTFTATEYAGYGSWDGTNGDLNEPDGSISASGGSGADRLQIMQKFDESFRVAVHTGQGGTCQQQALPPIENLRVTPIDFDRVELSFTLPTSMPDTSEVRRLRVRQLPDSTVEDYEPDQALDAVGVPGICSGDPDVDEGMDCVEAAPGTEVTMLISSLFGNYDYTFAVAYEDQCTNTSDPQLTDIRTPSQKFQQIETFCFVATAAYGAHWGEEVFALRRFRDRYLKSSPLGHALVRTYYAYGPTMAGAIKHSAVARATSRALLQPVAEFADRISPYGD